MRVTICCAVIFLLYVHANAQSQDSALFNLAYSNAVNIFIKSSSSQAPYLSGPAYPKYPFYISEGQPYFKYKVPVAGTLWYDGVRYDSVPLLYDEVADELLTQDYYQRELIRLPKEHIKEFAFATERFVFLSADERSVEPGFYQLLYNGNLKVYSREIKTIQEKANPVSMAERVIDSHLIYYMWIERRYKSFTKAKTFFSLFREKKKNVRNHLKGLGMSVKTLSAPAIVAAASYADQLKN